MRWMDTPRDSTRIKSGFLFFPKWIKGETRWLEYARWEQEYRPHYDGPEWYNLRWID